MKACIPRSDCVGSGQGSQRIPASCIATRAASAATSSAAGESLARTDGVEADRREGALSSAEVGFDFGVTPCRRRRGGGEGSGGGSDAERRRSN
eukprot:gene17569-20232_t